MSRGRSPRAATIDAVNQRSRGVEDTLLAKTSAPADPRSWTSWSEPTRDGTAADAQDRSHTSRRAALRQLDRFVLVDKIGEGGMGSVYAAFDRRLDRKVAIKVLHEQEADHPEHRARMLREAQAMARLAHPNVIQVFDVGEVDEQVYLAMEFVDGPTLAEWQADARSWSEILGMYVAVGRGLAAAHHSGLVHRDFKPHNVLVDGDGRPRVIDFGLARRGELDPAPDARVAAVTTSTPDELDPGDDDASGGAGLLNSPLTRGGALLGTPAYMAPEQLTHGELGPASDQFAFCVSLFEALYKERPFPRRSLSEALEELDAPPRSRPAKHPVPMWIHRAIVRGLARDPARRWPTLDALLDVLAQDPAYNPATGLRARLAVASGLIVLLVVLIVFGDAFEFEYADPTGGPFVLVPFIGAVVILGCYRIWRAAFTRSEVTKTLFWWAGAVALSMTLNRSLAWVAATPVSTTLLVDHVLLAAITGALGRALGPWSWSMVALFAGGGLYSALTPAGSLLSLEATLLICFAVSAVAQRLVPARATRASPTASPTARLG